MPPHILPEHPIAFVDEDGRRWPARVSADLGDSLLCNVYKPGLSRNNAPFLGLRFNEADGKINSTRFWGYILNTPEDLLPSNIDPDTGLLYKTPPAAAPPATPPTTHPLSFYNFGVALTRLQSGYRVTRKGWNGVGLWLELQVPDAGSKMTLPYIFLSYPANSPSYPNGARVPWLASQTDLLADDWYTVT